MFSTSILRVRVIFAVSLTTRIHSSDEILASFPIQPAHSGISSYSAKSIPNEVPNPNYVTDRLRISSILSTGYRKFDPGWVRELGGGCPLQTTPFTKLFLVAPQRAICGRREAWLGLGIGVQVAGHISAAR